MDLYQQYIAKSKYARYLDHEKRREHWPETVARYFDFMTKHLYEKHQYSIAPTLLNQLEQAVLSLEVMPSMRLMMTAGPAVQRAEVAAYNCAYLPIDNPVAFDEAMYILLCGTGVGFSVESRYIDRLPEIPELLFESDTVIVVQDTKAAWAKALRQLIALLYSGEIPKWDVSKVRPKGARLKVFGGRASGPEPLVDLFNFTVSVFKKARGRRLYSLEAHDLMCKIGQIVVVGGVRRASEISLSDLEDERMRRSKVGQWYILDPQRSLANNSAVYHGKPDAEVYMKEFLSLVESKSGERGIFNRKASELKAAQNGRRSPCKDFGTNPCCLVHDTLIMTTEGPLPIKDLVNRPFVAVVDGQEYEAPVGAWVAGSAEVFKVVTEHGFEVTGTKEHRIQTSNRGWVEIQDLEDQDKIVLNRHQPREWKGLGGSYEHGYLMGAFIGDGNFTKGISPKAQYTGQVKVWDHDFSPSIYSFVEDADSRIPHRKDWGGWYKAQNGYSVISISKLPGAYQVYHGKKEVSSYMESCSSEFQKGFVTGYFDADAHMEGSKQTGFRASLTSVSLVNLKAVQRMLLRQGVFSRIYLMKEADPVGSLGYPTKACYRLMVGSSSLVRFYECFGFKHDRKQSVLAQRVSEVSPYKQKFEDSFKERTSLGRQVVYDAQVDEVHAFDANGIVAHNSEIILRPNQFCNLSEVVIRPSDDEPEVARKVRLAAILGTFQSTLTDFTYIRKVWKKNTEEERLLGVSLTGIADNTLFNSARSEGLESRLSQLREVAVSTNAEYAQILGIPQSVAVTCSKPSGTVSQLVCCSSGMHDAHAPFYIRRVRGDNKDPLTAFLKEKGVPWELCANDPSNTTVFSFPIKAASHSFLRKDRSAVDHFDLWLTYQRHWCEHKPSVTISVRDHEWPSIAARVYEHFDEVTGISFLPFNDEDHSYVQAPYEEITKEQYEQLLAQMPKEINWDDLVEHEDNVEGTQTLACQGGFCEI